MMLRLADDSIDLKEKVGTLDFMLTSKRVKRAIKRWAQAAEKQKKK